MRESVATPLLVAAVAGGILNVAASLLGVPPRLGDLRVVAAAVAASVVALGLVGLAAWPLLAWRRRATGRTPHLAWLGFVLVVGALAPLAERVLFLDGLNVAERIAAGLALVLAPLAAAAGGRLLDRRLDVDAAAAVLAVAPALAAAALGVGWLVAYPLADRSLLVQLASIVPATVLAGVAVVALARRARPLPALPAVILVLLALAVALVPAPAPPTADAAVSTGGPRGGAARPSCVLLLTVDSLRADALPFHDPATSPKPAIDALYADSIVFADARSDGPWTKPGFASMLTGLSPLAHAATQTKSVLSDRAVTLAERMRELGYRTAAIGYNPVLSERHGFAQGFDEYRMYPGPAGGDSIGVKLLEQLEPGRYDAYEAGTEDLTAAALAWLDRRPETPFFLWLHYFDPHLPYAPPTRLVPPADPESRIRDEFNRLTEVRTGRFVPTPKERWRIRELYDAEVRLVDENVARVLDRLRAEDLYERCLIVFSSDHGEELFDHHGFEHGHTVYDEVLSVPLAVKPPGRPAHRVVDRSVSTASVFATVLELAGDERPAADGITPSLVPLWEAPEPGVAIAPLATGLLYYENRTALVLDGHKYVRTESGAESVYDLVRDPGETRPLEAPPSALVQRARTVIAERLRRSEGLRTKLLAGEAAARELDRDQQEHLRALGYVE